MDSVMNEMLSNMIILKAKKGRGDAPRLLNAQVSLLATLMRGF